MRTRAMLVGLVAAVALVAVQAAAGEGATTVRGVQSLAGSTAGGGTGDGTDGIYAMTGDLLGCWYTVTFVVTGQSPSGGLRASGTERFVGCLNTNGNRTCDAGEPSGTLSTTFTFTGKFAPTGAEIHGRCHHPIVGGTGDFVGASGVLSFTDIPSEGRFPYHGNLRF